MSSPREVTVSNLSCSFDAPKDKFNENEEDFIVRPR